MHNYISIVKNYITLIKPKIIILITFSAYVGIAITPQKFTGYNDFLILLAIALGASSSAAFNMWYDKDIDKEMSRVKTRPIPTGKISPKAALVYCAILYISALILMQQTTNLQATILLIIAIIFYAVIYTIILKRATCQNIVIGGIAGALAPIIAWVAKENSINIAPIILGLIIFTWTPGHFWALALYKIEEYKKTNIPMLPNIKGIQSTKNHIVFYNIITILLSFFLGFIIDINIYIYFTLTIIINLYLIYNTISCYKDIIAPIKLFTCSVKYLFILLIIILFSIK